MIGSYLVLLITSITCSMIGVFLVLRNLSMVADAISHSVLLGIVIAFFITQDISSPLLIIGAGIFGVITVAFIEALGKSKTVKRSDAIGVVFPMFFSIAVILISRYARNIHIDTDMVLMGEVIFASLDSISIFGIDLPYSFVKMGIMFIINLIFIIIFYKQLKITSFDQEYGFLIGIPIGFIFYSFMTLTSITAVVAFDAVGSILVLSFFIAPVASAHMISDDLESMFLWSAIIAIINCSIGSWIAINLNASMTGMCAVVGMVVFIIILFLHKKGVVYKFIQKRKTLENVKKEMFIFHIGNHMGDGRSKDENKVDQINIHLNWKIKEVDIISEKLISDSLIYKLGEEYSLTESGFTYYEYLCKKYGLNKKDGLNKCMWKN
ncbi:metal ABC transporter permease [Peptostreptococcus faecalis]|uniref:metal ABC transporter permease n=1 Tax=Peptostreptococcus faecalis TaxID=2045015 RepID=UPI000C7A21DE|nr:metal ABC transporter permease [Peptostreptococcus faecalis]